MIPRKRRNVYYAILTASCIFWLLYFREFIVEQYMRFALRNTHIVVGLSTTPYRIGRIFTTLPHIIDQNIHIDKIYLQIPYVFKRDNIEYIVPDWLYKMDGITIIRTEDYGPATKLLGILKNVELDEDSIIVTLDDDIKYKSNTVLHLAYAALKNPNKAIGISGTDIYQENEVRVYHDKILGLKTRYNSNTDVAILQGYAGIAYRKHFFDESIYDIVKLPEFCIQSDDIYISFNLAKRGITRRSLSNQFIKTTDIKSDIGLALNSHALQKTEPGPAMKNAQCIAYLQDSDPQVQFK